MSTVATSDRAPAHRVLTPAHIAVGDEAVELLDGRWDALLMRQVVPNPMLSSTWLRELVRWRTGTPFVAVVEEGGDYLAAAALELHHGRGLVPRVATWLGPKEQLFSPDMLVAPGRTDATETLLEAIFTKADVLSLWTPAGGAAAKALATVTPWRRSARWTERWLVPWPAPRLDYARKRTAYELRRANRHGAQIEVRIAAEADAVDAALIRLFRVHRDRWRDRRDEVARVATTAMHRRWNRRTIHRLAAAGRVRVAEVVEDGHTVASCLGLLHGRGGIGHTWAVRPGGVLRQPGHVAVLACVEALAGEGAAVIDLGIGCGEPNTPKARLGSVADPIVAVFAAGEGRRQRRLEAMHEVRSAVRRRHA